MTATIADTLVQITRLFDAPPARVFAAWMEREQWEAWIGPEGLDCEVPLFEPRVGGRYRIVMHLTDGRIVPVSGVFKAIEAPRRFAFTWGWENDPRETLVTVTLRDVGGKTELTLRHEGFDTVSDRDGHNKGWNGTLNKLVAYLAKTAH